MKPMGDYVLLKKREGQETTKGGIILTTESNNYEYADVIAVGPGLFTQTGDRISMTCKVDDAVLVSSRLLKGDNEVSFDDETYVLVREAEIVMVSNG